MSSSSVSPPFYTITFRECGENHVGNQKIYSECKGEPLSVDDLRKVKSNFEDIGVECELYLLSPPDDTPGGDDVEKAGVLVIRRGLDGILGEGSTDSLLKSLGEIEWDKKYYDTRRKKVLNKHARRNVCFGEHPQDPDYIIGKGRIVPYSEVPVLDSLRKRSPEFFGEKSRGAVGEGNYYYDSKKCGIGPHGDSETQAGVYYAVRVGGGGWICWHWFLDSKAIGDRYNIHLRHGDMYMMSLKACGYDWKRRSIPTLRHAAAGSLSSKYLRFGGKIDLSTHISIPESDDEDNYLRDSSGFVVTSIVCRKKK